jgi:hypothetical protein
MRASCPGWASTRFKTSRHENCGSGSTGSPQERHGAVHGSGKRKHTARSLRAEKMLARQPAITENRNHVRIANPN